MLTSRFLVTGATGKTGNAVVAELLKAGHPCAQWGSDEVVVEAHQTVRDLQGTVLVDQMVGQVFRRMG